MSADGKAAARRIFAAALQAVDVGAAIRQRIVKQGEALILAGRTVALEEVDRVLIIAMGKAAVPMYTAAAQALGRIAHQAVVVAPGETLPDSTRQSKDARVQATFLPGKHPTPGPESLQAARIILDMLATAGERTVVLYLVSGGASAMVEQPLDASLSLDDLVAFSRALVGSGLDIAAMNALRKHLSAVKGGRLAAAAAAAKMQCTLLISDVPAATPDAIASGPSLPDSTTVAEARLLAHALGKTSVLPRSIAEWFESPHLPETPKAGDVTFARSHWEVVLSSEHLSRAAVMAAEEQGFEAVVDNRCDDWEYREAGRYLLDRSLDLAGAGTRPSCLISVGEVGVATSLHAGAGGRNQQFALWCAEDLKLRGRAATVLSAGSDGIDGHSQAAGAVCDETTVAHALQAGLSARAALEAFDTAPLLHALGDAIYTGPTGNNLRDLRLILS